MRLLTVLSLLLFIGMLAFGCSSSNPPPEDGGTDAGVDAGIDAGADAGGDQAQAGNKTRTSVRSGGGTMQSGSHKARLHVGAPQPYGETEGPTHEARLGTGPTP